MSKSFTRGRQDPRL